MQVTVLNFDNVYQHQPFLQHIDAHWVDFHTMPNTNLFCEKNTLHELAMRLYQQHRNKITLIGSGNYHYMTYVLMAKIKKPFTLVLFDHHTDTLESPSVDLISCGSWVLEALKKMRNLQKVLIIGVSEDGEQHIPTSIEDKVSLYPKHQLRLNFNQALESILQTIPTDEVYISIDKDVLDEKEAMTAWDHGNMKLRQVLRIVKEVFQSKTILGLDICGEYPMNANEFGHKVKKATELNNFANQFLLHYIRRWWPGEKEPSDFISGLSS